MSLKNILVALVLTLPAIALAEAPPTAPNPTSNPTTATPANTPPTTTQPVTPTNPSSTVPAPTVNQPETVSDAQIVGILETVNQGEIDEGKDILARTQNADVKKYAQMMIDDHTALKQKLDDWMKANNVKAIDSQTKTELDKAGKQETTDLASVSGAALDRKYLDGAIADHAKVLDLIDKQLLADVHNADLKKAISDARPKIQTHLDEAKRIRGTLDTETPSKGTR